MYRLIGIFVFVSKNINRLKSGCSGLNIVSPKLMPSQTLRM